MTSSNKRIIICCDGTYDDFGDTVERKQPGSHTSRILRWLLPPFLYHLLWALRIFALIKVIERKLFGVRKAWNPFQSNISHLASAIKPRTIGGMPQMVIYVGGIGALGTPQSRFEEAVTGNTMNYKIRYVYRVIVDNFVEGDELFFFGYSRGAFTARAVVGFIRSAGILQKGNMGCFDRVWHTYTEHSADPNGNTGSRLPREKVACGLRETGLGDAAEDYARRSPKIRCVGVFDTVGSLKSPPLWLNTADDLEIARKARKRYDGLDVDVGEEVETVLQALALDECRFDFYPAVLVKPSARGQIFKQTWFPGVHSDMGGRNTTPLGLFPLAWMVSKLQEGKLLEFDDKYIRHKILDPLLSTSSKPHWQQIRPSHCIDHYPILRQLLPGAFLRWLRYVHRNPNMPAGPAAPHPDQQASVPDSKVHIAEQSGTNEQMFHWTVIDRMSGETRSYWESCVSLRRPNPLYPQGQISVTDIENRMDRPVAIDKELYSHFNET